MIKFLIGFLVAFIIAFFTYKTKSLTLGGAITALIIIFTSYYFGNWFTLTYLVFAYFAVAIIEKALKSRIQKHTESINKKSSARDSVQVAVNGGAAAICIVAYALTNQKAFFICFMVGIGEAIADSVASDIGILSHKNPVNILTFKRMEKGMSGGISFLGTASALFACILFGMIYFFYDLDLKGCIIIILASFFGCIIDSILGVLVQAKYQCAICGCKTEKTVHCNHSTVLLSGVRIIDNCIVNLFSNIIAVIFALVIF